MKLSRILATQISDLLTYAALPLFSLLLPAAVSRAMIVRLSGWRWLMADDINLSLQEAGKYIGIPDTDAWCRRARLVAMLEARDLRMIMWGRGGAVYSEIEGFDAIERARDRVLIGMHWGPSIAILGLLASRGQKPLLVYRNVEKSILRVRPFFYFFLVRSVRYIRRCCGPERAITIRGAGRKLAAQLKEPGSSVVVLDAPPAPDRSTVSDVVLGKAVAYNAGFPEILQDSGRESMFYAISLKQGNTGLRTLELGEAMRPAQGLIPLYSQHLDAHLRADSAQWRIWQVAGQFFVGTLPGDEEPRDTSAQNVEAIY